jgi:AcrR family transcriptional regulator
VRKDAERNRQRILEAARTGFAERGLSITLDDIAKLAGVGVGTVYRRFPNKELLIDALFEDRIGEVAAAAEEALGDDDGWRALTTFLERAIELIAGDRGLRELVLGTAYGPQRVQLARSRIKPLAERLVARAQAQGTLREDFAASDFPLLLMMIDAVVDTTRAVPDTWKRPLALIVDGMLARRDAPTPLPAPALDDDQLDAALRSWRP